MEFYRYKDRSIPKSRVNWNDSSLAQECSLTYLLSYSLRVGTVPLSKKLRLLYNKITPVIRIMAACTSYHGFPAIQEGSSNPPEAGALPLVPTEVISVGHLCGLLSVLLITNVILVNFECLHMASTLQVTELESRREQKKKTQGKTCYSYISQGALTKQRQKASRNKSSPNKNHKHPWM